MSLPIKAFSLKEVSQIIKKIKEHKALCYDLITGKILRQLPKKAIVLLTIIYNSVLRLSYFPVTQKFAQIVLLPKPGKSANEAFFIISLACSNIFENLLLNRVRNDTDILDTVPNYQFGVREHHSTIQQPHRIVNNFAARVEEKNNAQQRF
jgi:hypothetical protein